jgi:hypothetical protein
VVLALTGSCPKRAQAYGPNSSGKLEGDGGTSASQVRKQYVCLVRGAVDQAFQSTFPLKIREDKRRRAKERVVVAKAARTCFTREGCALWKDLERPEEEGGERHLASLVVAELMDSGRTHQIRRQLLCLIDAMPPVCSVIANTLLRAQSITLPGDCLH